MQLPDVLNVAIGLMVLFLLLSTIASVLAEIYGRALRYREEILYITINRLLTGLQDPPWSHARLLRDRLVNELLGYLKPGGRAYRIVKSWEPPSPKLPLPTDDPVDDERCAKIVADFWKSEGLRAVITPGCDAPEHLAKESFADMVLALTMPLDSRGAPPADRDAFLRRLDTCAEELPRHLRQVFAARATALEPAVAAGPDFGVAFRASIAAWYEEAMARASERYRRLMQRWLLWIGCGLAVVLNADAIRTAHLLGQDRDLAQSVATYGELMVMEDEEKARSEPIPADGKAKPTEIEKARAKLSSQLLELQKLERMGFPIGWTLDPALDYAPAAEWLEASDKIRCWFLWGAGLFLIKLIGLGITVLAVSQGAPFWYDLLHKITALRRGVAAEVAVAATGAGSASASTGGASVTGAPSAPAPLSIGPDLASGAPGYEPRRAYWLAELARLAYAAEAEVRRFAKDNGFLQCEFWSETASAVDTQVFALADRQVAVVAFRGTEPDVLADIVSDARIRRVRALADAADAGEIHEGFARGEAVVAESLIAWLEKHVPPGGIIHLTGHSLGGALATVFAARLARHPTLGPRLASLHTFGCPRVGDAGFTRLLDRRLGGAAVRFVHGHDPVPMVPPASAGGYRHLGLEICFLKPSGLRRSPGGLDRLLGLAAQAAVNLRTAGSEAVADHAMDDYVARCLAETGVSRLAAAV